MKLAVITDEVSQEVDEVLEFCNKHKVDAVELRSIEGLSIDLIGAEKAKEYKKVLDANNLSVCNLSGSFYKCELDSKEEIAQNIEKLKRLIEVAHILDCKSVRGFAFFRKGDFYEKVDQIAENFVKPIEMMKKEGMTVLLEADPGVYTTNNASLSTLLKKLDSPQVRCVFDPGNDMYDPFGEKPFPDGYNLVKDFITHVHIKDAKRIGDTGDSCKVGAGDVPFAQIFDSLKKDGYNGFVSLETHYRLTSEISDELLLVPQGYGFSANAYPASDESMIELRKLLGRY